MAENQVVLFKDSMVPAHIQSRLNGGLSNIEAKNNIPQLSFRGKVWRQVIDGEERALVNKDDEPITTIHLVILNHLKGRSRTFYEGSFEEGKSKPPACWSIDGEVPDPTVKEPQCDTCAKCPNAVKGSKITANAKETTACSVNKRMVVVPLSDLECTPMLLRIAQTSMWDKNNEEQEAKGFYAWDQYLDMLRARGATHTGIVATKVKFDPKVAYPKLLFAASRWLANEEIDIVQPRYEADDVMKLLRASEAVASIRKPKAEAPAEEPEDDAPPPPKKKAAPVAPVADEEPADDDPPPPPAKKKAAPVAAAEVEDDDPPPPPAKKKAAPVAEPEPEDDDPPPPPAKKKAAPVAAPAEDEDDAPAPAPKAKAKSDDGLADLVGEWKKKGA